MKILIAKPHSMVDLITNSSTEIFTIDTDKDIEVVREMIDTIQNQYPNKYGYRLFVDYLSAYEVPEYTGIYNDTDEIIKHLTMLGYTVTPPEKELDQLPIIKISGELGGIDPLVRDFINNNFTVIDYT